MSKRLLILCSITIVMLMLAPFATVSAQGEPVFVLTEDQINADFTIPNTAAHTISDLEVDVQEDGVHISFEMTTVQDGTSNTLSIIAILIGLFQPRVSHLELENTMISSFSASRSLRREVAGLVAQAWSDYVKGVVAENAIYMQYPDTMWIMEEEGIGFYLADTGSAGPGWCLECAKP